MKNGIEFSHDDGVLSCVVSTDVKVYDSYNEMPDQTEADDADWDAQVLRKDINVNGDKEAAKEEMAELLRYADEDGATEYVMEASELLDELFKREGKFYTASSDDTVWVWVE